MGAAATTITYERIDDGPNRGQDQSWNDTPMPAANRNASSTGAFATRMEYGPDGLVGQDRVSRTGRQANANSAGFAEVRVRHDEAGSPVEYLLVRRKWQSGSG